MGTSDAAELLAARAQPVATGRGASGYFSAPAASLDPNLFGQGNKMLPAVRTWLIGTLAHEWSHRYVSPAHWSQIWLAGSGATFQWNAPRSVDEPGDLDILIGVDFPMFYASNRRYAGTPEDDMAQRFNDEFRAGLNKQTAMQHIGNGIYETTWYVNAGATDIRDISPYAAYNVSADRWTVKPPVLAQDWNPRRDLPAGWVEQYDREGEQAQAILDEYNVRLKLLRSHTPGTPEYRNAAVRLAQTVRTGAEMFDDVHLGRHDAFRPGGGGYASYANARWQFGKKDGRVAALHKLKDLHAEATKDALGNVSDAHHALVSAALRGAH